MPSKLLLAAALLALGPGALPADSIGPQENLPGPGVGPAQAASPAPVSGPAQVSGTAGAGATAALEMAPVTVMGRAVDLVGIADSAAQGSVGQSDLAERPLLRPAEVLEAVPGMLITQHSGDGKANQYFTRGFNLDHGTDFAFDQDGIPINQPTNAHGQGYTDLNFMIPELVERVDYQKGPFNVEAGDFATAGSANFVYPDTLAHGIASLTMGEFGYQRAVVASQLHLLGGNLLYALEVVGYDGPWQVPEQFKKYNGFLRYSVGAADNRLTVSYSGYEASWDATNQMPADLIDSGAMSPYGNLAPTDGGNRDRDFLWATWKGRSGASETDALAYVGRSHLDLWNTFTFYLPYYDASTPGSGDLQNNGGYTNSLQQLDEGLAQGQFANPNATGGEQFLERDDRIREGGTLRTRFDHDWLDRFKTRNEVGLQVRNDSINLGLYNTDQRAIYETDSLNQVDEASFAPYVQNTTDWTPWLRSVVGFRQDIYAINVDNQTPAVQDGINLLTATGPSGSGILVNGQSLNNILTPLSGFNEGAGVGTNRSYFATEPEPKAALILRPAGEPYEFYLNFGQGFHSNDVRELAGGINPLARADGEEVGARYADGDTYQTTLAAWRLTLASELTFNGDSAQSTTNAASTREGLEWSNTFRERPFYVDLDGAVSQARFDTLDTLDNPLHPGYWVPEAVGAVGTLTFGVDKVWGWSADTRVRYFGPRNLTADGSIQSPETTLVSLQILRDLWAGQVLTFEIFNLFDSAVPDVSYYYAYALQNAGPQQSVMEHVTEPRSIRVSWSDSF